MGVGDFVFDMGPGEVLLLRPGQDHEMLKASHDLELVVVALTPELTSRCLRGALPSASRPFRVPDTELPWLREQLLSLDGPTSAETHAQIVGDLFRHSEKYFERGHPLARQTLRAVSQRPDLACFELAEQLRVQPSEISRSFHRHLGLTLVEFRNRHRLMRFIQLVDSGASLTRAALEASFGSYAQCHRAFRQLFDCAPRTYFNGRRVAIDTHVEPDSSPASFANLS